MINGYYTVQEFQTQIKRSKQWVYSLMERKRIDWIQFTPKTRLIIDNDKSRKYIANADKNNNLNIP